MSIKVQNKTKHLTLRLNKHNNNNIAFFPKQVGVGYIAPEQNEKKNQGPSF